MALDKTYTEIGLTGGIDAKTDPKQVAAPKLLTADNVMYLTEKMLRKRYGYATAGAALGTAATAASTFDSSAVLLQTGTALQKYTPTTNTYTSATGQLPTRLDSKGIYATNTLTTAGITPTPPGGLSIATNGTYTVWAWHEIFTPTLWIGVRDAASTSWVVPPFNLSSTQFSNPTVLHTGGYFYIFAIQTKPNGGNFDQNLVYWSVADANITAPTITSGGATLVTALYTNVSAATLKVGYGYNAITTNATNSDIVIGLAAATVVVNAYTNSAGVLVFQTSAGPLTMSTTAGTANTGKRISVAYVSGAGGNGLLVVGTNGSVTLVTAGATMTASTQVTAPFSNGGGVLRTGTNNPVSVLWATNTSAGGFYWLGSVDRTDASSDVREVFCQFFTFSSLNSFTLSTTATLNPPAQTTAAQLVSGAFMVNSLPCAWITAAGENETALGIYCNAYLMQAGGTDTATAVGYGKLLARTLYTAAGEVDAFTYSTNPGSGAMAAQAFAGMAGVQPPLNVTGQQWLWGLSERTQEVPYFLSAGELLGFIGGLRTVTIDFAPSRPIQLLPVAQGTLVCSAAPFLYDGTSCYEAGFSMGPTISYTGTPGSSVKYICVHATQDAYGNIIRSSPSVAQFASLVGGVAIVSPKITAFSDGFPHTVPNYTQGWLEWYRTIINGTTYFYIGATPCGVPYTENLTAASDATIQGNPILYTSAGEIENDPPPAVWHAAASKTRVFLIPSDNRNQLWYSKPFRAGHQVEFSALQTMLIDAAQGDNTAIAVLDTNVIVFKADAIYAFSGDGPDVTGSGVFNPPQRIQSDVGCINPESIVVTPDGIMFQSRRGIELLNRSFVVQYVGAPVESLVTTFVAATIVPTLYQARFVPASGTVLVYDYLFKRWSTYSGMSAAGATMLNGTYYWLSPAGTQLWKETPGTYTDNGAAIQMTIETPWLKMAGAQGWGRLYRLAVLGDFKSAHTMTASLAYDYQSSYTDSVTFTTSSGLINGDTVYQFRMSRVPRQIMQTFKLRLQDSSTTGESCDISTITLELGQKAGVAKLPPQKTV